MKNPIIVALDVDSPKEAYALSEKLSGSVGGFKIGPRLSLRADPQFFRDLATSGILFWDHKYFDIPSTTASAVEAAAELGAHWVTVHGTVGSECLKKLAQTEAKIKKAQPLFRILAVTVLTSFSKETLPPIWIDEPISTSVEKIARACIQEGLTSLVCSSEELELLRQKVPGTFFVVPGIRSTGGDLGDQKRVATPLQALKAGAGALVIGRPIIESKDPLSAVKAILESIKEV